MGKNTAAVFPLMHACLGGDKSTKFCFYQSFSLYLPLPLLLWWCYYAPVPVSRLKPIPLLCLVDSANPILVSPAPHLATSSVPPRTEEEKGTRREGGKGERCQTGEASLLSLARTPFTVV